MASVMEAVCETLTIREEKSHQIWWDFFVVLLGVEYLFEVFLYIVETCFDDRLKACLAYLETLLILGLVTLFKFGPMHRPQSLGTMLPIVPIVPART